MGDVNGKIDGEDSAVRIPRMVSELVWFSGAEFRPRFLFRTKIVSQK
jgi:hypothetical protein